jgi:hypothetical protein
MPYWEDSREAAPESRVEGMLAIRHPEASLDQSLLSDRLAAEKPSKKFRDEFGHTPLSIEEEIPWKCRRLVIGTGTGALPVMEEVKREAQQRKIDLAILPTAEAIKTLQENFAEANAILHVTC